MKLDQVIVVDNIPKDQYIKIVEQAVKYALISLPFTIDRMKIPNHISRSLNIAKGKIAENLFKWYCNNQNIVVDFNSCETPFYQIDKRDFVFNGAEWDIKNNFIYYHNNSIPNYINLPALIPNRHQKDQWHTRKNTKINNLNKVNYLFTFLKGANLTNGKRDKNFLEINLSVNQSQFISYLYHKYQGKPQVKKPFNEEVFWQKLAKLGNTNYYNLVFCPNLIITGFANKNHWNMFKDTGPFSQLNYQNYLTPYWYKKVGFKNSLIWLNGLLWTTITNKTAPIEKLTAFKNLIT